MTPRADCRVGKEISPHPICQRVMVTILFLDAEADNLLPMTSRIWVVCKGREMRKGFQDAEEFKEYVRAGET